MEESVNIKSKECENIYRNIISNSYAAKEKERSIPFHLSYCKKGKQQIRKENKTGNNGGKDMAVNDNPS